MSNEEQQDHGQQPQAAFGWTEIGSKRCHHPNLSDEHNIGTSTNGQFLRGHVCPDCGTTFHVGAWTPAGGAA